MGASSRILVKSKLFEPISVVEFTNALLSTWKTTGFRKQGDTIGLAVSGGVDSMALASLCSTIHCTSYNVFQSLQQVDNNNRVASALIPPRLNFHAFVVDHGVREGSNLEVQAVSKILEARNIPTKLLRIDWAGHKKPADLPNFESLARKYRFQALGMACKDLGIDSLFLAHHQDDQAETLMMRLINGHGMAGLTGVPQSAEIPECYGLHGVHESGGVDKTVWEVSSSSLPGSSTLIEQSLEFESGGVKIYRPLLQFTKDRLIATCQGDGMRWFEDHTNTDPSITMRNAVRHLYKNHVLPGALSKPALLELSNKSRATKEASLELTNAWLCQSSIKLDTRAGTLKVRFPDLCQYRQFRQSQLELNDEDAAALLLRRIAMFVTPQEHISLPSLTKAVERVFPECFAAEEAATLPTTFTVAGLQFKVSEPAKLRAGSQALGKCEWLISRQPYKASSSLPRLEVPGRSKALCRPEWSAWALYDGRFWIRVRNTSNQDIIVRPLNQLDLSGLKRSDWYRHRIRKMLAKRASGSIRWTLPALLIRDAEGKETLLAMPTMEGGVPDVAKLVKWEVRYKKVDKNILAVSNIT